MRILAIDTSGKNGSIALWDGQVRVRALQGEHEYSRVLLPAIEALLVESGHVPVELDALAVAMGPGAFTGLRVGLGTAQGLALGLARPCLGVNTLEAWAALHPEEALVAVALDAFRGEVLGTLCERGRLVRAPTSATPEAFAGELPEGTLVVGEGARLYAARIRAHRPDLQLDPSAPPLAASVARLAAEALRRGARGAAHELRPLYLREAYVARV